MTSASKVASMVPAQLPPAVAERARDVVSEGAREVTELAREVTERARDTAERAREAVGSAAAATPLGRSQRKRRLPAPLLSLLVLGTAIGVYLLVRARRSGEAASGQPGTS